MLGPLLLLIGGVLVGLLVVPLLQIIVTRAQAVVRERRRRRRTERAAANAEARVRAQMSELCPNGWSAQISLTHGPDEISPASGRRRNGVALVWTELQDETGRPAVMRRVSAPSITEALDAMVADRRTDETLEQIEQGAVADGALWPDL
ncbi:MAG: hypothetical protein WAK93_05090 [Solirubrobacteraceae bacterium]